MYPLHRRQSCWVQRALTGTEPMRRPVVRIIDLLVWVSRLRPYIVPYIVALSCLMPLSINAAAIGITTNSLATGVIGTPYSQTLTANGGMAPYTWSVSAGTLPPGLTLATTGIVSGTPTSTGTTTFTVTVTDKKSDTASKPLSITVNPPLAITTTSPLAAGIVGTAYSQTLTATGGSGVYTWSVSKGSLPPGLTLAGATGVISGTPTATGTASFTVTVADTATPKQMASQPLAITINPAPPVAITTTSLAAGTVGVAYSQTLTATGGTGSYTWSVSTGTLPAGLTLGSPSFTVTVTDGASHTAS